MICQFTISQLGVTVLSLFSMAVGLASTDNRPHYRQYSRDNAKAQGVVTAWVGKSIPNYYIVHLKDEARIDEFDDTINEVMIQANAETNTRKEPSNSLLHRYSQPNGFKGYAGRFNSAMLRKLQDSEQIASIEKDTIIRMADVQTAPLANWGLARISHHTKWQLNESFSYIDSAGEDVDVWILDTGVDEHLPDFENRAHMAASFIPGEPANDTNGHGTHVSGIVASKTYGVAKKANIYGVKVLNTYGDGRMSYLLSGIEYATKHARPGRTIINLSLSGGRSEALDRTVEAAYKAGIPVIVAAGNEQLDACDGSPSGTPTAFTVGAVDRNDVTAEFSNYGACIRLFAPGVDIASWWIGAEPTARTISGTSMAAPHVAGAAAILLGITKSNNPETIYEQLLQWTTNGTITRQPDDYTSPNRLLYLPYNFSSNTSTVTIISDIRHDNASTIARNNITSPNVTAINGLITTVTTSLIAPSPTIRQEEKANSAAATYHPHYYAYYSCLLTIALVYFFLLSLIYD